MHLFSWPYLFTLNFIFRENRTDSHQPFIKTYATLGFLWGNKRNHQTSDIILHWRHSRRLWWDSFLKKIITKTKLHYYSNFKWISGQYMVNMPVVCVAITLKLSKWKLITKRTNMTISKEKWWYNAGILLSVGHSKYISKL